MHKASALMLALLTTITLTFQSIAYAKDVQKVRFPPMQSADDVTHSYFVSLLSASLAATEEEYGKAEVEVLPTAYDQRLILSLLNHQGILDVVASAPTAERERRFRSTRVPLLMGLLSYRMFLIREDKLETFQQITKTDQLQKLTACSAEYWPGTQVLTQAQFKVRVAANFQQMFDLLLAGECDYFPRGITEGYGELHAFNEHNPELSGQLIAFDKVLLRYPLAVMFYTSHDNFELAGRIEKGLRQLQQTGDILKLLKKHSSSARAFPLSQWQDSQVFELSNPVMPKVVPTDNAALWLTLP
ncbi:substrate-binding periplasmic protein [Motilimonas pumila]|uniref:Solute-binding protein family 3/N-terminal domain-containing protein n=1 Tax=Motilimonas pumila TaxID=2303987 RepID=A0A418Y9W3_9GAMM|nr:hypothetical protein [Motilimonas pumila]RJG38294.1 hypothetical protein D1Z90_19080 [Motilimonas pumila]